MTLGHDAGSHGRQDSFGRRLEPVGWFVILSLLAVAGGRLLFWDGLSVLVALNSVTPLLYLPAWVVALMAVASRRWLLFGVTTVVLACHLVFALPELLAGKAIPAGTDAAPRLRLFSANVLIGKGEVDGYAHEIGASEPDIVVLQEASPLFHAALRQTGTLSQLLHEVVLPRSDPFSMVVASRWPLEDIAVLPAQGRPVLVRVTVAVPGQHVRLLAMHAIAPRLGHLKAWTDDLALLRRSVDQHGIPVVVVGDLNATWGNRSFRRILDLGLTDAAASRRAPFVMTWPRNRKGIPPVLRIDHVLTGNGAVVTRIVAGKGKGSDHRPLIADVALPTHDVD